LACLPAGRGKVRFPRVGKSPSARERRDELKILRR
jgi:hypothetical protein